MTQPVSATRPTKSNTTDYFLTNGDLFYSLTGSRPVENDNPGNLTFSSPSLSPGGQLGFENATGSLKFSIYSNRDQGLSALVRKLTVRIPQAIAQAQAAWNSAAKAISAAGLPSLGPFSYTLRDVIAGAPAITIPNPSNLAHPIIIPARPQFFDSGDLAALQKAGFTLDDPYLPQLQNIAGLETALAGQEGGNNPVNLKLFTGDGTTVSLNQVHDLDIVNGNNNSDTDINLDNPLDTKIANGQAIINDALASNNVGSDGATTIIDSDVANVSITGGTGIDKILHLANGSVITAGQATGGPPQFQLSIANNDLILGGNAKAGLASGSFISLQNSDFVLEPSAGALDGSAGSTQLLIANGNNQTLIGSSSSEILVAAGNADTLTADSANDTLIASGNNELLTADQTAPTNGAPFSNPTTTIIAVPTSNDDTFVSGVGNDVMIGGTGRNTFIVTPENSVVQTVDPSTDVTSYSVGSGGANVIWGGSGKSTYEFSGSNVVYILNVNSPDIQELSKLNVTDLTNYLLNVSPPEGQGGSFTGYGISIIINPNPADTVTLDGVNFNVIQQVPDGSPFPVDVGYTGDNGVGIGVDGFSHYGQGVPFVVQGFTSGQFGLIPDTGGFLLSKTPNPGPTGPISIDLNNFQLSSSSSGGGTNTNGASSGLGGTGTAMLGPVSPQSQALGAGEADTITGTTGADTLIGTVGSDVFDGKGAPAETSDTEIGNGGGDTFVYNQGYGDLTIEEADTAANPDNILAFGAGISAAPLTVTTDSSGDLILTLDTQDQIIIQNALNSGSGTIDGVQQVNFADGTSLSYAQLLAIADTGSPTNTNLFGDAGANIFDSKGFARAEIGGGGGDTFLYNRGYGALEIDEGDNSANPHNVLAFGAGITMADVTVTSDVFGDLFLSLGGGDQITLSFEQNGGAEGIQEVTFADGTSWTYAQLFQVADTGSPSNTSLFGGAGANIFDSKGFATLERGMGDGDTFLYNQGYGALTIVDDATAPNSANILAFGSCIDPSSVTVSNGANGSLVLTDGHSGDVVTLEDFDSQWIGDGVQQVTFADGTVWSVLKLLAMAGNGTVTIPQPDFEGPISIDERQLGATPITSLILQVSSVAWSVVRGGPNDANLILSDGTAQITLVDGTGAGVTIPQVSFSDGVVWTPAQILAMSLTQIGSPTNSSLIGNAPANIFDSMGFADFEQGQGGGDIFLYNVGYGALTIDEADSGAAPDNILKFGAGIAPSQVTVTADAGGDLILSLDATDQITLQNARNSANGTSYGVQQVVFADGTILTSQQLQAMADIGSAGTATLFGTACADIFDSKGFAGEEIGGGGGDTFIYNQGYGALTIDEADSAASPHNIIAFGAGITPSSLTVTADASGDLILTLDGNDQITLTNALNSGGGVTDGVQQVTFADGTSLSYAQLLALADTGSAGNTSLFGDAGANFLDSKGLASFEQGNGGGDTFLYNQGYGALTIDEADSAASPHNVLAFGAGITAASLTVTADTAGDLILSLNANDQITLSNALNSGGGMTDGVQQVTFADGTSLSYGQLLALADTASSNNTSLIGDTGANILDGKGIASFEQGNGGGDTFIYNQGYGALTIDETDTAANPDNIL
ncbi:MAG: calcium-binding protein, partial [Aliidongia sp.]